MFEFHTDKKRYFELTKSVTKEFIIPFINQHIKLPANAHILEIGCGEGGALAAFIDLGHIGYGIEMDQPRIEFAKQFMENEYKSSRVAFLNKDIYKVDVQKDIGKKFDLVILKDVIEHIPKQEVFMPELHKFLKPGGYVFFAFPPWYMPYGGHQQILNSKIASRLPYYHILPDKIYSVLMRLFGVDKNAVNFMLETKATGISIERFEKICKISSFDVLGNIHYLFNPIYKYKFGVEPKKQIGLIKAIPLVRNFFTMGVYYLVKSKSN